MEERKENTWNGIDVVSLCMRVWDNRRNILICSLLGAVIGLLINISIPKTYIARMSFAPEVEQKVSSGVSSIASMMGVSMDNSIDAISVDMFPYVVKSTPFIYELFSLPVETADGVNTDLLNYMKTYQRQPWWSHVMNAPFKLFNLIFRKDDECISDDGVLDLTNLPNSERAVVGYFSRNLIVMMDKKTGKIDMSLEMQDPMVAATVLDAVAKNLKDYMTTYRTTKEREDIKNLEVICECRKQDYYVAQNAYATFADANKNLVKLNAQAEQLKLQHEMQLAYQVYSQVATQLEGARIKEQQAKPVFVIIEPVAIPNRPSGPGKLAFMALFAIISGSVSVVWCLFLKALYSKFQNYFNS